MSSLYPRFLQSLIVVLLPVLLVIGSIRLLNTDKYLTFEYGKTSFPPDPFGFDQSQRLAYASVNFRYVRENQPIDTLAKLRLGDQPEYNARELKHMQDVQKTYQMTTRIWHFAIGITLLAGLALASEEETRKALLTALRVGGLLGAGLIATIGVLALIAWRVWFVAFHQVFFTVGTWSFNNSDTLIRLFPEKFWYDAALTVTVLSLAGGLSLAFLSWWLKPRYGGRDA